MVNLLCLTSWCLVVIIALWLLFAFLNNIGIYVIGGKWISKE